MNKNEGVKANMCGELPGFIVESYAYETWPVESLCIHAEDERKRICSPDRDPGKVVDWLRSKGEEVNASEVALKILENAREYVDGKKITNQEKYNEYIVQARDHIQEKIVEHAVPVLQHGQKFQGNTRGPSEKTKLLDHQLEKILWDIGPDATYRQVFKAIERECGWSSFFQEVDWDQETISFKDPDQREEEDTRTFKTVKHRLSQLKKNMFCKK